MINDIKVYSSFSEDFVSPLFPESGEKVSLSIAFSVKPEWVALKAISDLGLYFHYPCSEVSSFNGGYKYSAECCTSNDEFPFRYFFCFGYEGKSYYYSKCGVTRYTPKINDRFSLIKDLDAPSWIASSTCYQIFPDRFSIGDKSVGAVAGMYEFDGGVVSTPEFDSIPKPYNESRCLDFFNGDLKGIEDKIPYFKSIGVDTLYLNPITCSRTVHRFDSTDFFHIDEKLGGDKAYESLCKKLHENGMKIIVDISINHTSSDSEWLKKAKEDKDSEEREYYYLDESGKPRLWQGVPTLVQLNYSSEKLRDIVYRGKDAALKIFLREPYLQDGWRMDVAPEVGRSETDQLCQSVWREVRRELKKERKDLYIVGEDWDDSSEYMHGDMWDATMNYFGAGRPIRSWLGERDRFLSSGWGHSPEVDIRWNGFEMADSLKAGVDTSEGQMAYFQMNLFDSHDTPRLHNNRAIINEDNYFGAILTLYMLPGMPNVYYGDEIWLDGELGSVEASRYPMCWNEEKWNQKILLDHIALGRIRKEEWLSYSSFDVKAIDEDAFYISRFTSGRAYLAIVNKSEEERTVEVDLAMLPKKSATIKVGMGEADIRDEKLYVKLGKEKSILVYLED